MRVGEAARSSGLSPTTIRYDEDIGLVPEPARAANGYRDYEPSAVDRIRLPCPDRSLWLVDRDVTLTNHAMTTRGCGCARYHRAYVHKVVWAV